MWRLLLISLLLLLGPAASAQESVHRFEDPLLKGPAFPVYPGAEADQGYADLARYIIASMHGLDVRSLRTWTWHTQEGLDRVKAFYTDTFGYAFQCETEDHEVFMHKHWPLFLQVRLPNTEGTYIHCADGNLDLFSPVYNYSLREWQGGTMIVFHK